MERFTSMEKSIYQYRMERRNNKQEYLNNKYLLLIPSLLAVLGRLADEQISKQGTEEQGKVKYIIFQRLLTSEQTGSFEIYVGLSDAMLYLDEEMDYLFWKPELLYEDIDQAVWEIKQILSKEYVQIEEHELLCLKQKLFLDDWELFVGILKKIAGEIVGEIAKSSLLLEDEIQILCGNYMDRLDIIHKAKPFKEQQEENYG